MGILSNMNFFYYFSVFVLIGLTLVKSVPIDENAAVLSSKMAASDVLGGRTKRSASKEESFEFGENWEENDGNDFEEEYGDYEEKDDYADDYEEDYDDDEEEY